MGNFIDMTGWKMWEHGVPRSHWTVITRAENSSTGKVRWVCECDCNERNVQIVQANHLREGSSLQCSKCAHKITGESNSTHRETESRLYYIWCSMKSRCNRPTDDAYERYGGRGISVCTEWMNSFESFRNWSLDNGYQEDLSIERVNNDGNYCPENCRWATAIEQANNRRSNRILTYNNETHTLAEWSRLTGLDRHVITDRIDKFNWSIEKALATPVKRNVNKKDGERE